MTDEDINEIIVQSQGLPPTDASGDVDLWQVRHSLSLTPEQRVERYFRWMEFMRAAREAGKKLYGVDPRTLATAE